ncbi:hypothetical protein VTJ49DRAFT_2391 [Mycothermus thermophilus]|uniref:Uncharacterized protein n=1 Tax=Humicola insolens TaxID=85995 RepID=A0ABR3VN19_HUMIN
MAKRNCDALTADDYDEPVSISNKRRREQPVEAPKPDPTYGQRAAFPGLDGDDPVPFDDDLEFEESSDALAYLRAVRQEAHSVPHVLVAPKAGPQLPAHLQPSDPDFAGIDRSIYDDGVGDSRGYYHDGAYTAAPDPDSPSSTSSINGAEVDYDDSDDLTSPDRVALRNAALRRAYYTSLTARFEHLRSILHQIPPQSAIEALPPTHDACVPPFGQNSSTFRIWSRRLRTTDPLPAQVAAMDRHAVLRVLRVILGGKFLRRGCELRERTSRWLWALLARLPDRGELDYAEVGWVRELGKRAVLMMVSMAQMEALREEVDDLDGEVVEDEEENGSTEEKGEGVGHEVVDEEGEEEEEAGVSSAAAAPKDVEEQQPTEEATAQPKPANANAPEPTALAAEEEDEGGEMDMDIDEGELTDTDGIAVPNGKDIASTAVASDLDAAKARLLAQLEDVSSPGEKAGGPWEEEEAAMSAEERARLNMRATLNMILTVAGEFYGQRDLLEFRDPFPAV